MKNSPSPVAVGQVIDGKYRIERVIASGGMGVVVAARHLKLGTTVALKFLLRHAWENREALSRFLREGQALARITSAHVARVMDVGTLEHGEPYLVMEYLEGSDFGVVLKRRGPLPVGEAAAYLLQACEAVAEAHANGIVHRDLKPSNLFLTQHADGTPLVKVLDFGISKAVAVRPEDVGAAAETDATLGPTHDTNTGALVGSPLYMSPEQIRHARRVDERTDIWALGVILYELVCGKPPFEGESLSGTLAAVAADPPKRMAEFRTDVPAALEAIVTRCLQKAPEKRFASIAGLANALQVFAPPEARASVARIQRVLSASSRRPMSEGDASGSTDEHAATVPSWEGDTVLQTFAPFLRKRAPVLLGVTALAIAGGALYSSQKLPSASSPVPDAAPFAAPGSVPPRAVSVGAEPAPDAFPASSTAPPSASLTPPPSAPSALASTVAAGATGGRRPVGAGAGATKRAGVAASSKPKEPSTKSPETTGDGTANRK